MEKQHRCLSLALFVLVAITGLELFGGFEMFNKSNNMFYSISVINEYLKDLEAFSKLINVSVKFTARGKIKEIDFRRKSRKKTNKVFA
jgi:hypothetical protein